MALLKEKNNNIDESDLKEIYEMRRANLLNQLNHPLLKRLGAGDCRCDCEDCNQLETE